MIGHFSPLETESLALAEGDLIKIDLGVHIDGLCSLVAHSKVVSEGEEITGRKADVLCAAHQAALIAHRLIKPKNNNNTVTKAFRDVATEFNCNPVEGIHISAFLCFFSLKCLCAFLSDFFSDQFKRPMITMTGDLFFSESFIFFLKK